MLIFLLLCLLSAAFFIEFIQKYILRMKKPPVDELWIQLGKEDWFKELLKNPQMSEWIRLDKETGLLSDSYYVRKILDKEEHREGFIRYLNEKIKLS